MVAVVLGVAVVIEEARLVGPNGLVTAELPWIRAVTAADVIAGSATLLSASRTHQPVSGHRPPPWTPLVAGAGFAFAFLLLSFLIVAASDVAFGGRG